jgi:5-methylcytosine-specific restriction enzyme subunit McrC
MSKRHIIQVYEHERLRISDDRGLTEGHLDLLIKYNEQHGGKFFSVIHQGIKFSQYVGIIQVKDITIEILPKADKAVSDNEKGMWRTILIDMLIECRVLNIESWGYANLDVQKKSILDIYLELYLNEVERLIREGLIKKYIKSEGNRIALKGQLVFSKNISKNYIHKERFYVRHSEYNLSNLFNQILYKAVKIIPQISTAAFLKDRVNRILFNFPEMPDFKVDEKSFDTLPRDRKSLRYSRSIIAAKMILLNYRPDISGGKNDVISILFDMNKLWEEFMYRRLKKAAQHEASVTKQLRKNFWFNHNENYDRTVRPDIIISKGEKNIVIDTKWKAESGKFPGDDDLKQMFVYNLFWKADRAFLLYPGKKQNLTGSYYQFEQHGSKSEGGYHSKCSLCFINLVDDFGRLVGVGPFSDFLKTI